MDPKETLARALYWLRFPERDDAKLPHSVQWSYNRDAEMLIARLEAEGVLVVVAQ